MQFLEVIEQKLTELLRPENENRTIDDIVTSTIVVNYSPIL